MARNPAFVAASEPWKYCIKDTVLIVHQTVDGMAGAVGMRIGKGEFEIGGERFQLGEFFYQRFAEIGLCLDPV